jgi:hypothetical protein
MIAGVSNCNHRAMPRARVERWRAVQFSVLYAIWNPDRVQNWNDLHCGSAR